MKNRISQKLFIAGILIGTAGFLIPAHSAPITFDTEAEFTNNFEVLNPGVNWVNDGGNGLVRATTANDNASMVYDTTPDGTPTNTFANNYQVDVDLRFSSSSGSPSFGIYFGVDSSRDGLMAYLNNAGSTTDAVRFYSGGPISSVAVGSSRQSASGALIGTGEWLHLRLTVLENTGSGEITATFAGSSTSTPNTPLWSYNYTYSASDSSGHFGPAEVGFRLSPGASGPDIDLDNFEVNVIPEPSSLVLLGLSLMAGCLMGIRRKSR